MGQGANRNAPCWCGSGRKFKYCHDGREKQEAFNFGEHQAKVTKLFSRKRCIYCEATGSGLAGKVIKAHTIPRSGSLKKIAEQGHVLRFWPSAEMYKKSEQGTANPLVLQKIGISNASVFSGFCSLHDNKLFSPIEDAPFTASKQQCLLLGYRAVAREYYTKDAQLQDTDNIFELDKGRSIFEQVIIQSELRAYQASVAIGQTDISAQNRIYTQALVTGDFSNTRGYVILFEETPTVMCSCSILLQYDLLGKKIQNLLSPKMAQGLAVNVFATDEGGAVVFTWLPDSDEVATLFIDSLHRVEANRLTSVLINLLFTSSENVYFNPSWWNLLSIEQQESIKERTRHGTPGYPRIADNFIDNGAQVGDWVIKKRFYVT